MKRIANKVAVQTLMYSTDPMIDIRIYDRETMFDKNPKLLYEGRKLDFSRLGYEVLNGVSVLKIMSSSVKHLTIKDGYLEITIDSKFD